MQLNPKRKPDPSFVAWVSVPIYQNWARASRYCKPFAVSVETGSNALCNGHVADLKIILNRDGRSAVCQKYDNNYANIEIHLVAVPNVILDTRV